MPPFAGNNPAVPAAASRSDQPTQVSRDLLFMQACMALHQNAGYSHAQVEVQGLYGRSRTTYVLCSESKLFIKWGPDDPNNVANFIDLQTGDEKLREVNAGFTLQELCVAIIATFSEKTNVQVKSRY